jgi:hypothetical protein
MFHPPYLRAGAAAANRPLCKNHGNIMAEAWPLGRLFWAFACPAARFVLGFTTGASDVKGHDMGFAISACAPSAAQFHLANATPAKPALVPKPPAPPPVAPVTPPASAEAIMMENACHQDPPAGIEFDDVPFQDDAVLSDDIIRPDPPKADKTAPE